MLKSGGMLFRIFGLLLFTTTILFIGLTVSFYIFKDNILQDDIQFQNPSVTLISHLEENKLLEEKNRASLQEFITSIASSPRFFRITILDAKGIIIASTEKELLGVPMMSDMIDYVIRRGIRSFPVTRTFDTEEITETAWPILSNSKVTGILLLAIRPQTTEQSHFSRLPRFATTLMILLGLLIIIVFGIYINRFFRGLGKLSGTVDRLARGEYQARLEMNPDSEFALLAQSFNQIAETMESRIQDREKHVKIMAQMAGGVAHEIRNPLGGIKGFAELLMSETPTSDPRHKYVSYILKEVNSLEALVQNVLDFARPKTPSYSLTLLEEILESLMPPLQQKISFLKSEGTKITLFMHHDPAIQTIEADAGQIRQLLLNLALNACDAMEDAGGNLEIIIRAFSAGDIPDFNTAHPEQYITLLVSDTGEGMDEETLEQLFTPFFTTKSSGTGLGLAISKKIVEIHNGKMHISSIQGKGTNFKIVLPRASIVKESYT